MARSRLKNYVTRYAAGREVDKTTRNLASSIQYIHFADRLLIVNILLSRLFLCHFLFWQTYLCIPVTRQQASILDDNSHVTIISRNQMTTGGSSNQAYSFTSERNGKICSHYDFLLKAFQTCIKKVN
jgi:hypothetical protein